MITTIGIFFILIGILTIVLKPLLKSIPLLKAIPLLKWFTTQRSLQILVFGLLLSVISGMFFYAEPGTAYAVQYPWGGQKAVFHQGIHTKMWGRLIPIQFEMPIKYVMPNSKGELSKQSRYTHFDKAREWEFNDAVKGRIATSIVISINISNDEQFLSVADRNKSENNLIQSRIVPNIDQSIKNTCKLMAAQDYISGQAADFDRFFQDQLENGMYVLEEYTIQENPEIIGDSTTIRTVVSNQNRQKRYRIKRDKDGNEIRVDGNSLKSYGLTVIQAVVNEIDWEPTFDIRLKLQKEEVAQTQLEKQQAEREYYRAQKEKAKGEAEKATERARLEKEQIQQTIAAETEAKVAGFNLIKEKKQYEVELFKAKSKKVAAEAQYYENAKLVSAGLTPQERAEWNYKIAVGVAGELKMLQLPTTYIENGGGSSSKTNLLESLIGAELANKMIKSPVAK